MHIRFNVVCSDVLYHKIINCDDDNIYSQTLLRMQQSPVIMSVVFHDQLC